MIKKYFSDLETKYNWIPFLFVLLNVIGAFLIILGFLELISVSLEAIGYLIFVLGGYAAIKMKKLYYLLGFSRVIVGGVFIASGLIKANDPEGFSYKLLEYFEEGALNLVFLNDYAVLLSIIASVAEVVLGFAVLLGTKIRLASWSLMALTLFFGWLTYYTATCDPLATYPKEHKVVTAEFTDAQRQTIESDTTQRIINENENFVIYETQEPYQCVKTCGCFGDAFKNSIGRSLDPWESFGKDAILFYFVLIIFLFQGRIKLNTKKEDYVLILGGLLILGFLCKVFDDWYFPLLFSMLVLLGALLIKKLRIGGSQFVWVMAIFVTSAAVGFSVYCYSFLPMKDYRAYAIGNDLIKMMNNGEPGVYETSFIYKNKETGEEVGLSQEEYLADFENYNNNYDFVDKIQKTIKEPKETSIQDFAPFKLYEDITEDELNDASLKSTAEEGRLEKITIKHLYKERTYGYVDSLDVDEAFDPSYYPDSLYEDLGEVEIKKEGDIKIDFTQYLLSRDKVFLLVVRQLRKTNMSNIEAVTELANACKEKGIPFYCLTASFQEEIDEFKEKTGGEFEFLTADDTELKILVRSNPGLLLLKKATVVDKWSFRTIPSFEDVKSKLD